MANGRTPAGGDRSEITFTDAEGGRVDNADAAAAAEIVEYAGDYEIARTYMTRGPATPEWTPPGEVPADVAEFVKDTWDVYVRDGSGIYQLVTTLPGLLEALEVANHPEAAQRAAVEQFTTAAAWQAAPDSLKATVQDWLEE